MSYRFNKLKMLPSWKIQIGDSDKIEFDGKQVRRVANSESQQYFSASADNNPDFVFSHEEVHQLIQEGRLKIDAGGLHPIIADHRAAIDGKTLAELDQAVVDTALWRQEYCDAFLALEAADPNTRRDDASMKKIAPILHEKVMQNAEHRGTIKGRAGKLILVRKRPSGPQIRKWVNRYEQANCDPISLVDKRKLNSGNTSSRFPAEITVLMNALRWEYCNRERPTKRSIHSTLKGKVKELNVARVESGLEPYRCPSIQVMNKKIDTLNQYVVHSARYGAEAARKKFQAVYEGVIVERPMERVEMDEWKINLSTLMTSSSLRDKFTEGQLAAIKRDRCWITCAIDVATRCILALDISTKAPSTASGLRALEMVVMDKSEIGLSHGTKERWFQHGKMELLCTDNGAAFINGSFKAAAIKVAQRVATAPSGFPEMRGTIERIFGTINTSLLPYLSGRTFESPEARGDYESEALASLTVDELLSILVRYIVDVYHGEQHEGLRGERPVDAWKRLTSLYSVPPPPSLEERRHIFGLEFQRTISKIGVEFLRIPYQSEALQDIWIVNHVNPVRIKVDLYDLGAISVFDGKGWISVPCVFPEYQGVTVPEWVDAANALSKRFGANAVYFEEVKAAALDDIKRIVDRSRNYLKISSGYFTPDQLERKERDYRFSFRLRDPIAEGIDDLLDISESDATGGQAPGEANPPSQDTAPQEATSKPRKPATTKRDSQKKSSFGSPKDWKEKKL